MCFWDPLQLVLFTSFCSCSKAKESACSVFETMSKLKVIESCWSAEPCSQSPPPPTPNPSTPRSNCCLLPGLHLKSELARNFYCQPPQKATWASELVVDAALDLNLWSSQYKEEFFFIPTCSSYLPRLSPPSESVHRHRHPRSQWKTSESSGHLCIRAGILQGTSIKGDICLSTQHESIHGLISQVCWRLKVREQKPQCKKKKITHFSA